jgi:hypothetical protein
MMDYDLTGTVMKNNCITAKNRRQSNKRGQRAFIMNKLNTPTD